MAKRAVKGPPRGFKCIGGQGGHGEDSRKWVDIVFSGHLIGRYRGGSRGLINITCLPLPPYLS